MSAPTSVKMMHPLFIDSKIRRRHLINYILHIWFSLIPTVFLEVGYSILWSHIPLWLSIMLLPLNILAAYYLLVLTAIGIMKLRLLYVNLVHTPREGIFPRDIKNADYRFLNIRNFIRLFPSYLISSTPFPWMRRFLYFFAFGIKVGKGGINWDCWITPEFVEIGEKVIIGHGSVILSNYIENDKLIIKKITLEDNVIIGSKNAILPGVTIKKNAILWGGSYVLPLQTLEENSVYFGSPAKFIKWRSDINFSPDQIKKETKSEEV